MKSMHSAIGAAMIAATALTATPAMAQVGDLDPVEVAAAARYALPLAFDGYMTRCSASLAADGYARRSAPRLRVKFSEGIDAAWPAAKAALLKMTAEDAGDMSAMFDMMGDDALRPFVDGMIGGLVSQEIKTEDCATIERGLEILDPLPAANVAELIGFVVEMGAREKDESTGEATR